MRSIRLAELLERLPADTEKRVDQVRRDFNNALRDAMRAETRLYLRRPGSAEDGRDDRIVVPVHAVPGLPTKLENLEFGEDFWLISILGRYRGALETVSNGCSRLLDMVAQIARQPAGEAIVADLGGRLPLVGEQTNALLERLDAYDPVTKILEVDEDVLGIYRYRLNELLSFDSATADIDLYWGVIGIVAGLLGSTVESLTVVVLAHELGHAYTHLGADIDGKRWHTKDFHNSEHGLVEGLAQYYTHLVLQRLKTKRPEAFDAYEKLRPKQPPAYQSHVPWLEEFTPEEVRLAMIEIRRNGVLTLNEFVAALGNAKKTLRKSKS